MLIWTGLAIFLLLHSAWNDIQRRKIPNKSVLFLFLLGLLVSAMKVSPFSVPLEKAILAGGLAFVALLPFYALGWMGAGDVKLAAGLGIWLGVELLLPVWALSILMAVLYTKIPIWLYARKPFSASDIDNLTQTSHKKFIPYGAMLCASALIIGGHSII